MGDMPLSRGQRRHLVSVYATICHLLRQMEDAATEGRSPSGIGAPLTAIAADDTAAILQPLIDLRERVRRLAVQCAPEELAGYETPQSPTATMVWLSNLHNRVRAAVDDLQPGRVRKYGPISAEQAEMVGQLHAELLQMVLAARPALDAVSGAAACGR
jgi:hypothetical protein